MKITVWCDTQCPYGLLAARNMFTAMAEFEHIEDIDIEYKSFILPQCDMGQQASWVDNAATIFSITQEQAAITLEQISTKSKEVGIDVDFFNAKVASSRPSHRMIQYFKVWDKEHNLHGMKALTPMWANMVLQLAFQSTEDISDTETLVNLAQKIGVDPQVAREVITSDTYDAAIDSDIADGRAMNIKKLPYFLIGKDVSFAGAQSIEIFKEALNQAWES